MESHERDRLLQEQMEEILERAYEATVSLVFHIELNGHMDEIIIMIEGYYSDIVEDYGLPKQIIERDFARGIIIEAIRRDMDDRDYKI